MKQPTFTLAAKCAPQRNLLAAIVRAGLGAVELYLSDAMLKNPKAIIALCHSFPLRYALHAPSDGYNPSALVAVARGVNAEVVVFHDVYWADEWKEIARIFKKTNSRVCIENIATAHEPAKLMRCFGFGRCLDLEHLQMECSGVFKEEFVRLIRETSHIHLTGYKHGSNTWHTPLYINPGHSKSLLGLIKQAGYQGMVVSEAKQSYQGVKEFLRLRKFYKSWRNQQSR